MISLTPAGRGQVVTHGLYQEAEQAEIQKQFEGASAKPVAQPEQAPQTVQIAPPRNAVTLDMYSELQVELAEVEAEVSRLRARIEQLEAASSQVPGAQS